MGEVPHSEVISSVQKKRWLDFRPKLNYKSNLLCSMPPTIDPRNWKPITPGEATAHQQRLEIRGRLRREYWTKAYHPVNYKHFNHYLTDKAFTHFNKAKGVYHLKETFQLKSVGTLKAFIAGCVLPVSYFVYFAKYYKASPKMKSVVQD